VKESLPLGLKLRDDGKYGSSIASLTRRNSYIEALREMGLMGLRSFEKFIPEIYLRSSTADRLALLQGLIDTDGGSSTRTAYVTTSSLLRENLLELIRSLGGLPMWSEHESYYKKDGKRVDCRNKYIINTRLNENPFLLQRKRDQFKVRKCNDARRIKSIERLPDTEMQCITVEHETGLYVTNDYIVTHNSGKWEVPDKSIATNLQLGIYALVGSILFPGRQVYAELYYLRSGKRKGHTFALEELEIVKERIVETANVIINDNSFHPTQQVFRCGFCDHAASGACGTGVYRNMKKANK
jgi:hypothetical protein